MSLKNSSFQGFLRQLNSILGKSTQRRRQQTAFGVPAEQLETRQLLAADLSKVLYQEAILDTTGPDSLVPSYFVAFSGPMNASDIQAATGASSVTPYEPMPNTFDVVFDTPITLQTAADKISVLNNFQYLSPNIDQAVELRMIPNDTFFGAQWYLQNTGQTNGTPGADLNVTSVWDKYNGSGVTVAVVDDGVDILHQDLIGNISAAGIDLVSNDNDPTPLNFATHGTAVAGIIAAVGNNNQGITGTAFGADIAGIRLISSGPTGLNGVAAPRIASALTHALNTVSISNNSWGPDGNGDISVLPAQVANALNTGTVTGRAGKGIVYVWAAGNDAATNDRVDYDPYASSRYVIAVGAVDDTGKHSAYSETGSSLLVSAYSAPAAIMTLDLADNAGVNADPPTGSNVDPDQERYRGQLLNRNYTQTLVGDTSTAAAEVSGVVALMLDANPTLSYRDVMDILVRTSKRADPNDTEWVQNGAGLWVNYKYGFGVVDAQAAVTMAETYTNRAPLVVDSTSLVPVNQLVPDGTSSGVTKTVDSTSAISLEHVELSISATHQRRGDLRVTLISPDGTRAVMAEQRVLPQGQPSSNYNNYTFTTPRFWGEESIGTWTVEVQDMLTGVTGTFDSFQLKFYGVELPLALSVAPRSIAEDAGPNAAIGTVSRPASANLSLPLDVFLASSDTTEATVPAMVTIPAGSRSVTFPIDAVDDMLLDGVQTTRLTATVGAFTAGVNLDVLDHEDLLVTVDKTVFPEDAGPGAATLTITRSNTNIDPANKIVVVNNKLLRFNEAGVQVGTDIDIPWPGGVRPVGQDAHDVAIMDNGNIAVYNGTTNAKLSVYNVGTGVWNHTSLAGLSTVPGDNGTGGITTSGDFVFLTDTETGSGDPFGLVRVDVKTGVVTRFGTKSFGNRLFTNTDFDASIYEISPVDGSVLKQISLPFGTNTGDAGIAFDGTFVWYIAGGTNKLLKVNPDTSTVVDTFNLSFNSVSRNIEGLGWLNGKIYMADTTQDDILVFDPTLRLITQVFDEDVFSGLYLRDGLTGNPANNSLFVLAQLGLSGTYDVFEISAATGSIIRALSGNVSDSGLAVVGSSLYIGSQSTNNLRIYSLPNLTRLADIVVPSNPFLFHTYGLGSDGIPGLVPTSFRYRDTTVGLDGNLYALDVAGISVGVFDPVTLAPLRFLQLDKSVRTIAVGKNGEIFGGDSNGMVHAFNNLGKLVKSASSGRGVIDDIELNGAGKILLSDAGGAYATTDVTLLNFTSFSTPYVGDTFVSYGESPFFSTADLVVTITNSDPTEVSVALTVIIPAGQSFINVPLDAVDDFIRDGGQLVQLTVSAQGYFGSGLSVVVLDAEGIKVDVIANSISEAAGKAATKVRVSRTDVGGPFDFISTQQFNNNTVLDIPDNGKTYSPIVVAPQASLLTDLNVTVNFQHQWLGDLDVYLISPKGTRVELFTDLVSNGNSLVGTILDDQANSSINLGSSPYTGRFRPEGLLNAFNGESPAGTWLLEVGDDNTTDVGKLLSWSMTMQTAGLEGVTVTLQSSVPGKANFNGSATKTVTIPVNQSEILVDLDAVDNTILDGSTNVIIRATSTNIVDFSLGQDQVVVTDSETLTFTVNKSTVSEAAGLGALTGTLKRNNTNLAAAYIVSLTSSNTGKLTVPATVTIQPNQTTATFAINAVDNTVVDGDFLVTLTAVAPAYVSNPTVKITVLDLEPVLQLTTLTPNVVENGGSLSVTVSRLDQSPAQLALPLTVMLSADAGLTVPVSVQIPANSTTKSFTVNIIDNAKLDGMRTAKVYASGNLIQPGQITISIADYETLSVTVDHSSFLENAGAKAATGMVHRSNTENLGQALIVALSSSDVTELTVPATVTIPAGQMSATFFIAAVNDPELDGAQNVVITAIAAGYVNGTVGITVLDHEPPVLTGPASTTVEPRPKVVWNTIPGALRYDVWVSNLSSGVAQLLRNVKVTGNTYTPPENLGIGRYRVWVRAIDNLEQPGFWSVGRNFTINTAPRITAPVNVLITGGTFPKITWTAIADAAKYELWVNNLTTGKTLVINRRGASALNTTSYVSTEGLGSGTYSIWVRGMNASGEFGLWSAPVKHTVLAAPVIVGTTTGGTFDRTPTFSWTAITGATNYDVWIGNAKTNAITIRNQFVKSTSFTAPTDMAIGDYTIWVRAQSGNTYSAWSVAKSFSIGLPPKITSVTTVGTQNAAPKFTWTSIGETETYELWVNNAAGVRVLYSKSITTTTYTSAANLPSGNYRVWVRAISKMGEISAWSSPTNFTIASSIIPESSSLPGESAVFASLVFDDQQLTPDGSPAVDSILIDTQSDNQTESGPVQQVAPATDAMAAIPVKFDEPASAGTAEFDAVMAEWQSADWWSETPQQKDDRGFETTAALAAGLGLFVRNGRTSDSRKKRTLS